MVWDSFAASSYPPVPNPDPSGSAIVAQQFFVGMRSDASSAVTFEYGVIGTGTVAVALGLPVEELIGTPLPQSNKQADGTITIYVPKSAVGNPQPGDLLGAVNGRTFTGDTADTMNIERSTALIDHTFVKAQTDNSYPAATYTVSGNVSSALVNFALSSLGSLASASSSHFSGAYPALSAINGERTGNFWGTATGGWNDGTRGLWPDNLDIDFGGSRTISEIRVYTLQNNWKTAGEPNLTTPATGEGILDFDVQTWNGTAWVTVPGGQVTGNDKAMRVFPFTAITTSKVRVAVNNSRNNWSRIVEVEALGSACPAVP
jgi:hypothetical protein